MCLLCVITAITVPTTARYDRHTLIALYTDSLGVRHPPLFQLVDEKYGTAEFAGRRVRDLRLIHVPSGVHVVFVGRVAERLYHVYGAFDFQTDVVHFHLGLL